MGECVKETRLKLGDGSGGLRSVVSSQRFKFHYSSYQFSFPLNSKMLTVYRLIEMVSFELGKEIEKDVDFRYMKIHIFALRWRDELGAGR